MRIITKDVLNGGETIKEQIPVSVELDTTVEQEGEVESFHFAETGSLVDLGDKQYLRYKETTGVKEVPVTFRFTDNGDVFLTRESDTRLRMQFADGQLIPTHYQTAYGLMKIDVKTISLSSEIDLENLNGHIEVDYELYAETQLVGKYQIRLQFNA